MSQRELVVLGTASQAPSRSRNHNGYFLRWDDEGVLFDPGEGTQRQMLFAGVTASQITRICITHLHGDHCLGLPGVLARMSHVYSKAVSSVVEGDHVAIHWIFELTDKSGNVRRIDEVALQQWRGDKISRAFLYDPSKPKA